MRHPAAVLLCALLCLPALADKIVLKDGRVYEGTIVDQTPESVKIDIGKNGAKVTLQMNQIERIERSAASAEQLYRAKLLITDRKSTDQLVQLADWCVMNKLDAKAAEHYLETLAIQPDHARARGRLSDLGYREVDGKWLSKEEHEKLLNPPQEPAKPEVPKGPTSADLARDRGQWVLTVSAGKLQGVGVWASAEGALWVAGPAAAATQGAEVDVAAGRKAQAKVLVRDRLRQIAVWDTDEVGLPAPRPEYGALPEKDPLIALSPGGIVADVFARGWEQVMPEVWRIRLEGPEGGAAIFNLEGRLVGLSGDGRGAVGMFDLQRLLLVRAPLPEGAQNAAGSYWRATDMPEGPAMEIVRQGSRLESFEPGLGYDEMNRAAALGADLAKIGTKMTANIDDHVAALKLARHLARGGRVPFSLASAGLLRSQCGSLFQTLPRLTPTELARLRAALDGLGPDPCGLEAAATGEVARAEGILFSTKDIRSEIDLQIAAFPFLGPDPIGSLEDATKRMYDAVHAERDFAARVRGACSRPDPGRREDLAALEAGPGALAEFPALREKALQAMTAMTAARIAVRLREFRADLGDYPAQVPAGFEDPASGKPFDYRPEKNGFTLVSPGGESFRLKE